jgi:hypothetical protein
MGLGVCLKILMKRNFSKPLAIIKGGHSWFLSLTVFVYFKTLNLVLFLLIWDRISYDPKTRSEPLPLHNLYACVSSNSISDSSETSSQLFTLPVWSEALNLDFAFTRTATGNLVISGCSVTFF